MVAGLWIPEPTGVCFSGHLRHRHHFLVDINMDFADSYRDELKNKLGYKTYPIITVVDKDGEKLIGGTEHLQAFMSD